MLNKSYLGLVFLCVNVIAHAGPLQEARINRVQKSVVIVETNGSSKAAKEGDIARGNQAIRTGAQSAAELLFPDQTLARLGSDTLFTFDAASRKMDLQNGTLLFQIPKGVGGASIRTGAITAAITGTTGFIERGSTHYKLVLLEGTLRVFLNDRLRESMLVTGGQMLIGPIKNASLKNWQTVPIDTGMIMKTSKLLDRKKFKPLSSEALKKIESVVEDQKQKLHTGAMAPTNVVIDGYGTTLLAVENVSDAIEQDEKTPAPDSQPTPKPTSTPAATPVVTPTPGPTPVVTPTPGPTPGVTPTPLPTPVNTPPTEPGDETADYDAVNGAAQGDDFAFVRLRFHARPTVIREPENYTIGNSAGTVIDLRPTNPTISSFNGDGDDDDSRSSASGTTYSGPVLDGSASYFLFGANSDIDAQRAFDDRFGANEDYAFPASGVKVFSFEELRLNGTPQILASETSHVALLSEKGIKIDNTISLNNLGSLTLAGIDGDISLDDESRITANASTFAFLHLYSRSGDVKLEGTVNLAGGNLYIDASKDLSLQDKGLLQFNRGRFYALGKIDLSGSVTADYLQLDSRGKIDLKGDIQTRRLFALSDSEIDVAQPIVAAPAIGQITGGLVSLDAADTVKISSNITATGSRDGSVAGNAPVIKIRSRRLTGTAISITGTAQLKALLELAGTGTGGKVTVTSTGGDIAINGNIVAEKGTIDVQNTGASGLIRLDGATLAADVVKIGALGNNGTLTIKDGRISADSLLKLYAGGSNGTIRFQDNVTLAGDSTKIISANTVQIDDQKIVTINGPAPAQVFSNNPHFTGSGGDGTTSGTFGNKGATTSPLSNSPGY